MKRLWFSLISLIFGLLWVTHVNLCYAQKPLDILTLLYTNNINGEIDPCPPETPESASAVWPEEEHGQRGFETAGREYLFWIRVIFFKRYSSPIPENELKMVTEKAYLLIESSNVMGYDALGIGDDDLSLGKEFLMEISKKAKFPFLSSNLMDEKSKKLLFLPSLVKKIDGLRIGIFSLFSPDFFVGQGDPRRKGLTFRPPVETAQSMVKELQPKTDLIILLSHLSYPKDMEIAQTVPGIHLIVGGHTGINLPHPPIVNQHTVILQTAAKGMYGARLDLTLHSHEPAFYNTTTRQTVEQNINTFNLRLSEAKSETDKAQWRKLIEDTERSLKQFHGKNEFTNVLSPLGESIKDDPDIKKMVEAFRLKFPEPEKSQSPK